MSQNSKPRNGLLAIRVSSDKQGLDGDSPEAQREQGERYAATHNIIITETVILMESASHEDQPMQEVINRCKDKSKGIEVVLIKSIDRFTRGGGDYYSPLKRQLTKLGVALEDMYGVIGKRQVNTLEHTGFKYYWSEFNPTQKSEYLEAERAKDEMRDIMSRMIGAEIRYTQLGYWMRQPPYGFISQKVDTKNGKRLILQPHPEESPYMIRLFEMRAESIYSDQQIADELNRLGFRTRIRYVRDKYDRTKIVRQIGGHKMTAKMVDRYVHNPIYAGVIKEKWTYDKPVKAQFDGLVLPALYNAANRGKYIIKIDAQNVVTLYRKQPPAHLTNKNMHNPEFPYKKVVTCSECKRTLLGSASRGKAGKYYPAYHCSKDGHYFRVPKAVFEQTIDDVVRRLEIAPEKLADLMSAIEQAWLEKQAQTAQDNQKVLEQRQAIETQIKAGVDRMKLVTSKTAIKYIEEDIEGLEKQLTQLDEQQANKSAETVDMEVVLQYARYLVEHLADILLHLRNPLRKAAFFGAIFNAVPTYEDLVGGTQKNSPIPGVNELFRIALSPNPNMVTPRGIEPRLPD
ncbi:recombinase family protein [bacterium]|nr:MAG: recombinase family protein [bacterium]